MSSGRRSELPEDLERLGRHLETAVAAAVRRHSRRQAVMSFVGAVVIAVPFALAGAETNLAPGVGTMPRFAPDPVAVAVAPEPAANRFAVRRVAAHWVPPLPMQPCLYAKGCRVPRDPAFPPMRLVRY
jgi:hypothetical protein